MAKSLDDVFDLFIPDRSPSSVESPPRTSAIADTHENTGAAIADIQENAGAAIAAPIGCDDLIRANLAWSLATAIARGGRRVTLFCLDTGALWPRSAPPLGLHTLCVSSRSDRWVAGAIAAQPDDVRLVALPWARLVGIAAAGAVPSSLLLFTNGSRPTSAPAQLSALRRLAPSLRVMEVATGHPAGAAGEDSIVVLSGLDDLRAPLGARRGLQLDTSLGRELTALSTRLLAL